MADVITRLKLESGEYDSKIARAVSGLKRMEEECRNVGGTLAILEKDQLDYVRSLGQMQTVSTSVRGKIGELSNAYTELRSQYNRLTDEEKNGDFGKALSGSLNQLKGRIGEAKNELKDINGELSDSGGAFEALASKLMINVDAMKLLDIGLSAVKGALGVAKDAFLASEATVDEWGRTTASAQALYEGFLTAINNGDISGYLSNINDIVKAARDAYNELDKLGSMKTIQAPGMSRQQLENDRIRMMIQTGRYIAPRDGRTGDIWDIFGGSSMKDGQILTPEQIKMFEGLLQIGLQNITKLVENEVNQSNKAIDAYYNSLAKQNGLSLKEFRQGTSSWDEFSKKMAGYDKYLEWKNEATRTFYRNGGQGYYVAPDTNNPYREFRKWGTFRVDKEGKNSYNDLVNLIKSRDQQVSQVYGTISQSYRVVNRAEGVTVRNIMSGGSGGGTGDSGGATVKEATEYQKIQRQINDLINEAYTTTNERRVAIRGEVSDLQKQLKVYDDIKDEVMGITKEVQKPVTGISITSMTGMSSYIGMLQDDLKKIDFGKEGSDAIYQSISQSLADTSMLQSLVGESLRVGLGTAMFDVADELGRDFWTRAMEGGVENVDWDAILSKINEKRKELGLGELTADYQKGTTSSKSKDDKKEVKLSDAVGQIGSGLSSITNGMEQLGVEIPQGLQNVVNGIQTVTSILTGIASIVSAIQAISTAKLLKFMAGGGIVGRAAGGMYIPGNSFSGDRLRMPVVGGGMIGVNSGELILNRVQQGVLADALQGGSQQAPFAQPYVDGEKIFLGMNNTSKRMGRGEIVTTSTLRRLGLI